jgi:hypothetical protein
MPSINTHHYSWDDWYGLDFMSAHRRRENMRSTLLGSSRPQRDGESKIPSGSLSSRKTNGGSASTVAPHEPPRTSHTCPACSKECRYHSDLVRHYQTRHQNKRWICTDKSSGKTTLEHCISCQKKRAYYTPSNAQVQLRDKHSIPKEISKTWVKEIAKKDEQTPTLLSHRSSLPLPSRSRSHQ